jgi:hypothetical protein
MEGHDVPPDVLTSVVHWLRKGCETEKRNALPDDRCVLSRLDDLRRAALQGAQYCNNDGCTTVAQLKEFKVCPQCKTTRYCSDACQKQDWSTGGHKKTFGKFCGGYAM